MSDVPHEQLRDWMRKRDDDSGDQLTRQALDYLDGRIERAARWNIAYLSAVLLIGGGMLTFLWSINSELADLELSVVAHTSDPHPKAVREVAYQALRDAHEARADIGALTARVEAAAAAATRAANEVRELRDEVRSDLRELRK